ncbi:predicted protein [Sclerotinia sclerotiorum 1980 UF-70]|uniref:Uncharacterized protein n=1 Tax=Sclerotinia sclerotiorum (strain ATCC 18683 / 1980 / Ss-1) TaxID=665079 RepID=A7F1V9_SCLS1|nr:predicted protein [Sclerotinia sclerotiorum 1980 UF-70]EDN95701.1 predicted protein [Sclerotinia sclerotiorum 1980 UF-70]
MGCTSKNMNDDMLGTHGKGFKLAALMIIRHGYQAKFTASGFHWIFCWGKKEKKTLWCFLSRVKRKSPQKELSSQGLEASQFRLRIHGKMSPREWGNYIARNRS